MAEMLLFSAFTCEHLLREMDGTVSAIRLVDIFQIPVPIPPDFHVMFWLIATAKYAFGEDPGEVEFKFTHVLHDGDRKEIASQDPKVRVTVTELNGHPISPGVGVILQIHLKIETTKNSYIEIEVGGIVRAKVPITLLPVESHGN